MPVDDMQRARAETLSPSELALLTSREVARILGVTDRGVRKLVDSGRLRAYRLSDGRSKLRIASSDLALYLESQRVPVETRG